MLLVGIVLGLGMVFVFVMYCWSIWGLVLGCWFVLFGGMLAMFWCLGLVLGCWCLFCLKGVVFIFVFFVLGMFW